LHAHIYGRKSSFNVQKVLWLVGELAVDPALRSLADRWMDWPQCTLQPDFLSGIFWGYYRTPAAQRNMSAVDANIRRCAQHFQPLDAILADRRFLLGAEFSLADSPAGTNLFRYFNIDMARPNVPHVERWYRSLQERPAYRAHVMIPFGDLYGRLAY
jgi:glutathione S-transferase